MQVHFGGVRPSDYVRQMLGNIGFIDTSGKAYELDINGAPLSLSGYTDFSEGQSVSPIDMSSFKAMTRITLMHDLDALRKDAQSQCKSSHLVFCGHNHLYESAFFPRLAGKLMMLRGYSQKINGEPAPISVLRSDVEGDTVVVNGKGNVRHFMTGRLARLASPVGPSIVTLV